MLHLPWAQFCNQLQCDKVEIFLVSLTVVTHLYSATAGRKIAPNTGANATKFFTLATKS